MTESNKNMLVSMWSQCRLTPEQVETAYQKGKLTLTERDEILNTPRTCE